MPFPTILENMRNKRHFKWILRILFAVLLTGLFILIRQIGRPVCSKCNIILVSIDTLSAQHLPCYGYKWNTAPNLCNYAKENIFFSNSYSQSPTTLNSHFSLFTSLYPSTHRVVSVSGGQLDNKYLTLAQILRKNGYDTIYHGPASDPHLPLDKGIERGFNTIEFGKYDSVQSWEDTFPKLLLNSERKKPTFIFFHTYDVHAPYLTGHSQNHLFTNLPEYHNIPLAVEDYAKLPLSYYKGMPGCTSFMNANKLLLPKDVKSDLENIDKMKTATSLEEAKDIFSRLSLNVRNTCTMWWYGHSIDTNDSNQVNYLRALYDEKIYTMDKDIAKLFEFLQNPTVKDNTILIITSDHGEEFMEHGVLFHGNNISKVETQVPLIMHIPDIASRKIQQLVQGIDVLPTILSLLGIKPPPQAQGISLVDLILNRPNHLTNSYVKAEYHGEAAIQYKNWRYYFNADNKTPHALYNIELDAGEKNNIIAKKTKVGIFLKNLIPMR